MTSHLAKFFYFNLLITLGGTKEDTSTPLLYNSNIALEEINVLKKAYNIIKQSNNLELLLNYHDLFNKLAEKKGSWR